MHLPLAVTYQQVVNQRVDFAEANVGCVVDECNVVKLMNEPLVLIITDSFKHQVHWLNTALVPHWRR